MTIANLDHVREVIAPVEWREYSKGSYSPSFCGYTANHYHSGDPDGGWVLYSRGEGGCWNQRTKPEKPPRPGARPKRIDGQWMWVMVATVVKTHILWKRVSEEMPDTDTTVLMGLADGECEMGWWDSEHDCWRVVSAVALDDAPVFWAHLPEVPKVESEVA